MDKETAVILRNKKDSKRIRQCRVVFSYKQDHEDELNLNVGDVIDILGEEEEGWWRGVLNGKIGVFPSNFVEEINLDKLKSSREDLTIHNDGDTNLPLPPKPAKILCEVKYSYKAQNEDELNLKEGDIVTLLSKDGQDAGWWKGNSMVWSDPFPIKPSSIASQRKSLENKHQIQSEKTDNLGHGDNKITPPVPSKKPTIAVKKSPSGSGSTGGLFSGIKKKIVDVVDGATSSKSSPAAKTESVENTSENVFDQVERVSLLTDVRATRVKAPGDRQTPPSVVFREEEPSIPNGNVVEPLNLDMVSEQSGSSDTDGTEVKPKLREWEKHKAPWLAEMKMSQAKRTSTSPGPPENKLKLTPTEKTEVEDTKPKVETEMSKSLNALTSTPLSSKTKPGETEKVPLRPKPNLTNIPTPRPASIQSVTPVIPPSEVTQKPPTPAHPKISPISRTPSPSLHKVEKGVLNEVRNMDQDVTISFKQYTELVERIHKLELLVEKQNVLHTAAIDELKGKLQLETELRHMLQVQLEKVATHNLMQKH
ncbi:hypothetical protein HHI36_012434 [Cryptolaemus montrouzieri]|uniref:SH3 domain-containing protein n=1 Tax=Cryptolaemus montrouzieri TaxID=559131 RepID=A0ABD2NEL3_9CUCU